LRISENNLLDIVIKTAYYKSNGKTDMDEPSKAPEVKPVETPVEPPVEEKPEVKPEEEKPLEPETRTPEPTPEPKPESKEEPDEVAPEDEAAISKVVARQLNPVQKRMEEQANIIETTNFLAAKPEFAKYRDTIIKHMNHSAYKNIPVDRIAKMVAGDDLMKIGAEKEREAQKKVAETKAGGNTVRTTPTGKDWHTATKEEFEAQKASVLGRQGQ
jgi:hypothetical protein